MAEKDPKLVNAGVSDYNKPKRTPSHPTKSWIVVARNAEGKTKTIRFGQQGVTTEGSSPKTERGKARRKSFRARHKCDTATDILSARYWACKHLW
jgi:hypothetical protein